MAAWLRRGSEFYHWDLYRSFGRPPVLAPPPWALCARIWEATAADRDAEGEARIAAPGPIEPADWVEVLRSATGGRSVCLVVPDATRVGAWRRLLPTVLATLGETFAERTLLVATGTHRPAAADELAAHFALPEGPGDSEQPLAGWRVVQNSDDDFRTHRPVGTTSAGTEIRLHPAYLEADARVLLGDISYHYFAGFGGGPKLVFPGCGDPGAAGRNHRKALRERGGAVDLDPACAPGVASGNPVLEEIEEAAGFAPAHWALVPVEQPPPFAELDPATPVPFPLTVIQGPESEVRVRARESHDQMHRVAFTQRPDLLVVDAGGHPRDASFLQAQKSLQHARRFLEPGGRILLVARCGVGLASSMLERFVAAPEAFRPDTEDLHLQTLAALRGVTQRYEIGLWSDLAPEVVHALGLEPLGDERSAREWLRRIPGPRWGWLPRVERFLPAPGWLGGGDAAGLD